MFDGGVWSGVAAILDFLSRIGGLLLGLAVLALGGGAILQAKALQKRLVAALKAYPQAQVSWRALELRSSLPGLLWLPVERLARWIYGGVVRLRNRLRGKDSTSGAAPAPGYSAGYQAGAADTARCMERYRSYDPASGTYLGRDRRRHPCP